MDDNDLDAYAGGRLCFLRKEKRLSLSTVSLITGLTQYRINELEHGTGYSATKKECEQLAIAYEVNVDKIKKWYLGEK